MFRGHGEAKTKLKMMKIQFKNKDRAIQRKPHHILKIILVKKARFEKKWRYYNYSTTKTLSYQNYSPYCSKAASVDILIVWVIKDTYRSRPFRRFTIHHSHPLIFSNFPLLKACSITGTRFKYSSFVFIWPPDSIKSRLITLFSM